MMGKDPGGFLKRASFIYIFMRPQPQPDSPPSLCSVKMLSFHGSFLLEAGSGGVVLPGVHHTATQGQIGTRAIFTHKETELCIFTGDTVFSYLC